MKIDTMRRIDYLAGVPLCFLMTWLLRLLSPFISKDQGGEPKKVLFIELSEMGSAIIVDPAMRKMKRSGAEIYFLIFDSNVGSLKLLNTVPEANIFTISITGLVPLALDTFRFLLWSRKQNIDTVIDLELFSRYTALLTGLSGAKRRIGYHSFHNEGLYRGEMLTRRVAYNPHQHIAKSFIALVNTALAKKEELPYSKSLISDDEIKLAKADVSEMQLASVREKIKLVYPAFDPVESRIVLINPNASDLLPQRRWMPDRYVQLMRMILEAHEDVVILITGAPAERAEAEGLKAQVKSDRCTNFAGCVAFAELPALYTQSSLMVSNDSGPGHFSSITDMKTFVIFGPETPQLYGSLGNSTPIYAGLACSPCVSAANHRKTPCHDNVCLQVIHPQQVFDLVQQELLA
ncbi:MAG: glycosyltransferase family 9 protein [Candidatus Polarisedimenticolaceae bacterium]|nr:glycosyltransferase family 9 protein [Candidatus Polarisedimenticolaceae bacterium]